MTDFVGGRAGVLPSQSLRKALEEGIVHAPVEIPPSSVQPASLDLRLGNEAYRLRSSFLPEGQAIEEKLERLTMDTMDLTQGAVLEQNRPYLIPLLEELALPDDLWAKANPRSSIGRLDIFTRVLTDRSHTFDEMRSGYQGRMYLEVVPLSFTVKVKAGISLSQLRLMAGDPRCSDDDIRQLHAERGLVFMRQSSVRATSITVGNGLFLSIDLRTKLGETVGYRSKKNSKLLDLTKSGPHEVDDFWEPVVSEKGNRLILEPGEFYLLLSAESIQIPPEYAAEMTAYDPTSGELRTHYAGFFDPGFGHKPGALHQGSRAALEVRAHDVPFMIEERQRVCRIAFERMLETPDLLYGQEIGSSYQDQRMTLSKYFLQEPEAQGDQLELSAVEYNRADPRM